MSCTGCAVVDGEAAADVERVEAAELLAPRQPQQLRAGLERLDVLGGIADLRADVERQPAHVDAQVGRQRAPAPAASSGSQPNLRDRSHTAPGARNETRSSRLACARQVRELAHLVGVVGDEGAHAEVERVGDVGRALDRMGVDAALGGYSQAPHQLHLAGGGEIEEAALGDHGLHHRRVRQGLQRVVQVDVRQRLR